MRKPGLGKRHTAKEKVATGRTIASVPKKRRKRNYPPTTQEFLAGGGKITKIPMPKEMEHAHREPVARKPSFRRTGRMQP